MVHPIFMAVLRRPDLLAQHAANYVALLRENAADVGKRLSGQARGRHPGRNEHNGGHLRSCTRSWPRAGLHSRR